MTVRFRIQPYRQIDAAEDHLGRSSVGHFPRMSEQEAYESGRGAWKVGERATREPLVLITDSTDTVLAVVQPGKWTIHDDGRRSFEAEVLSEGEIHDRYVGQPDPTPHASRNPVGYTVLPEEIEMSACFCGCGEETARDFAPGHDQRAIHDRIREHFNGSVKQFIQWIDSNPPASRV